MSSELRNINENNKVLNVLAGVSIFIIVSYLVIDSWWVSAQTSSAVSLYYGGDYYYGIPFPYLKLSFCMFLCFPLIFLGIYILKKYSLKDKRWAINTLATCFFLAGVSLLTYGLVLYSVFSYESEIIIYFGITGDSDYHSVELALVCLQIIAYFSLATIVFLIKKLNNDNKNLKILNEYKYIILLPLVMKIVEFFIQIAYINLSKSGYFFYYYISVSSILKIFTKIMFAVAFAIIALKLLQEKNEETISKIGKISTFIFLATSVFTFVFSYALVIPIDIDNNNLYLDEDIMAFTLLPSYILSGICRAISITSFLFILGALGLVLLNDKMKESEKSNLIKNSKNPILIILIVTSFFYIIQNSYLYITSGYKLGSFTSFYFGDFDYSMMDYEFAALKSDWLILSLSLILIFCYYILKKNSQKVETQKWNKFLGITSLTFFACFIVNFIVRLIWFHNYSAFESDASFAVGLYFVKIFETAAFLLLGISLVLMKKKLPQEDYSKISFLKPKLFGVGIIILGSAGFFNFWQSLISLAFPPTQATANAYTAMADIYFILYEVSMIFLLVLLAIVVYRLFATNKVLSILTKTITTLMLTILIPLKVMLLFGGLLPETPYAYEFLESIEFLFADVFLDGFASLCFFVLVVFIGYFLIEWQLNKKKLVFS